MNDALIGYSGFVGSALMRQRSFQHQYRSTDIADIRGGRFGTVLCAGAPGQKWIANRDPERDAESISSLIEHLNKITCECFVLISTVDVFDNPVGIDEDNSPVEKGLHPYGLNRLRLERFVEERFPGALIVRLPGLVGPGLRKNVIYDMQNDNDLDMIDSRSVFQFYPMVNLWRDIEIALRSGLSLIHLTAAPVSVEDVAREGFGREFVQEILPQPAKYDFRSRHASIYGVEGPYQYSQQETVLAIRAYAQSEPRTQ